MSPLRLRSMSVSTNIYRGFESIRRCIQRSTSLLVIKNHGTSKNGIALNFSAKNGRKLSYLEIMYTPGSAGEISLSKDTESKNGSGSIVDSKSAVLSGHLYV